MVRHQISVRETRTKSRISLITVVGVGSAVKGGVRILTTTNTYAVIAIK
jgi:hypothetical protein